MSYNPYANPYANTSSSSSSSYPYAAYTQPSGPSYPSQTSYAGAGPSIPAGYDMGASGGFDMNLAEQSSIYTPEAAKKGGYTYGANGKGEKGKARTTVIRKGGGETWEDESLMEWDPSHFRLFIGDLDPALSDDLFTQSFSGARYPSFVKAKIVRDKHTNKGKGYGFVSYKDPEDFLKAWKEMNGKYVGTRPVKISKATTKVGAVNIGAKKARVMDEKKRGKSGTVSFSKAKLAEAEGGLNSGFGPERPERKSYIRR